MRKNYFEYQRTVIKDIGRKVGSSPTIEFLDYCLECFVEISLRLDFGWPWRLN